MLRRLTVLMCVASTALILTGCPKGNSDYDAGRKASSVQDYDSALVDFDRALRADPNNPEYKLRATQARFEETKAAQQSYSDFGDQSCCLQNVMLSGPDGPEPLKQARAFSPQNV